MDLVILVMSSFKLLAHVLNMSVLVVVKSMIEVRIVCAQEEDVPGSLVLVGRVSELNYIVLARGSLRS